MPILAALDKCNCGLCNKLTKIRYQHCLREVYANKSTNNHISRKIPENIFYMILDHPLNKNT